MNLKLDSPERMVAGKHLGMYIAIKMEAGNWELGRTNVGEWYFITPSVDISHKGIPITSTSLPNLKSERGAISIKENTPKLGQKLKP